MNRVPIGQVAKINPRSPKGLEDLHEISFIAMASVSEDGKIAVQETRHYGAVKKGYTYFERGDILLAKITPCFENGKAALADSLKHQVGFGSTEFHVLRVDPTKVSAKYLFFLVWSGRFRYLGEKVMNGAAGQKRVPADFIENFEIPLPSLDDQVRIAYLLGRVEGLIDQRKQYLQQLDDLLKSVFLEMFGDPILNPQGFPVRRLSDFYINPKDGTKCGPFGSALRKEELVESGVPVWNMDNIGADSQMALPFRMWITPEKYDELAGYSVQDGDIIISRAGTVGKMCVACMHGERAIISTNLIRLRLGARLRPLHFVSLMRYCKGRVGRLKTGADGAFTHMNTGILDSLEFPYPPIELQDQFGVIATKVETIKSRYQQSLADLEALYGALSQQVFKGELDLSRVPLPLIAPLELQPVMPTDRAPSPAAAQPVNLPNTDLLLKALENRERVEDLLQFWLEAYRTQLAGAPFSAQAFVAAAQSRLAELHPDNDFEPGAEDYEHIKTWVLDALADGRLTQGYADEPRSTQGGRKRMTSHFRARRVLRG